MCCFAMFVHCSVFKISSPLKSSKEYMFYVIYMLPTLNMLKHSGIRRRISDNYKKMYINYSTIFVVLNLHNMIASAVFKYSFNLNLALKII